jgi:hypothetical protein
VDGSVPALLAEWESFYVIVGSSAGALTGLQFVVITLGTEQRTLGGGESIGAFGTPTVVHFCAALMVSAVMSMPFHRLGSAGVCLGVCGVVGLVYAMMVVRRARRQTHYRPELEDWVFHAVLPVVAYAGLVVAAVGMKRWPGPGLFGVAGAALLLVFVGIHNAWDAVTFVAVRPEGEGRDQRRG